MCRFKSLQCLQNAPAFLATVMKTGWGKLIQGLKRYLSSLVIHISFGWTIIGDILSSIALNTEDILVAALIRRLAKHQLENKTTLFQKGIAMIRN
jgi:hypothetical protein